MSQDSNPFRTPEFYKLQKEWEKKLEKSGLENIEQPDGNLKFWASTHYQVRYDATIWEAKEEYYRLAGQFLHDYPFESALDKTIWELHSTATSIRDIHRQFRRRRKKVGRIYIQTTIKELAKRMLEKCKNKT